VDAIYEQATCKLKPDPLILASADPVAIDAVSARIMGFDPMKIDYIRLAHEDGLGAARPEEIELRGEDISRLDFGFKVGDNFASRIDDLLWFGPFRGIQKFLFRTPLVYLFVFGSYFYHDCIWWPFVGRRIMEVIESNTSWGKLLSRY
jgi:hypothetical protein